MPTVDSGIYQLNIGPWFYFGQSQSLGLRRSQHLCDLRKGRHSNPVMQRAWDKYQDFDWRVSLRCPIPDLDREEQRLLDAFHGTENCLNIASCAAAPARGTSRSAGERRRVSEAMTGRVVGEETREKLRAASTGRRATAETRARMSASALARPKKAQRRCTYPRAHISHLLSRRPSVTLRHADGRITTDAPLAIARAERLPVRGLYELLLGYRLVFKHWSLADDMHRCP